jgi:hypothetical protein
VNLEGEPHLEAYSSVTNPERYRVLHNAARDLLDRLERKYLVRRLDGLDTAPELVERFQALEAVRLVPDSDDSAPLAIAFTEHPGIATRFGPWAQRAYPHCGCDACNEDPEGLIGELNRNADILTTEGFVEEVGPAGLSIAFGRGHSWTPLAAGDPRAEQPKTQRWAPWPVRQP